MNADDALSKAINRHLKLPKFRKKELPLFILLLITYLLISLLGESGHENEYLVTRVIDGDTIEIEGGQRIRYIGIDTPETVDPSSPTQCYGIEASNKNTELVENKYVRLEKDVSETDRYGRLLRYVWVGDVFVNESLVREGYAYSSSYPPDIKYQELFRSAESEARENGRGLWGTCDFKK